MPGDPMFYLVGWTTTLLMGIGKGAFGGGLAILGVPLLALVVDPLQGAIMVAVLIAAMDLFAIGSFKRLPSMKKAMVVPTKAVFESPRASRYIATGGPPAWATKVVKPEAVPASKANGGETGSWPAGAVRPRRNQCAVKARVMTPMISVTMRASTIRNTA